MVLNIYSEKVKYDEKQQTKNQRVNLLYVHYTTVVYLAAHHACLI